MARRALLSPDNTRLVSSATAWEIATKHRIGRLGGVDAILASYAEHVAALPAEDLPVTTEHALMAGRFPQPHRDPFDRLLAAQAFLEAVPILTIDRVFSTFGVPTIW